MKLAGPVLISAALILGFTEASVAEPPHPTNIQEQDHGYGWILTDPEGRTLYTSLRDENGTSACSGPCAQQWPPLLVPEEAVAGGDWSIVRRTDGARQWAFRGKPLYRSIRDVGPGDANGEEPNGPWRIALRPIAAPPGFGPWRTLLGQVLTDERQLTLYTFERDTATGSGCAKECTRTYKPAEAAALAHAIGDFGIVVRSEGLRQWAYRNKPLYRSVLDTRPGDTAGDAAAKGWRAVVFEPPPPVPAWITIQESDAGEVFADQRGKTLYMFTAGRAGAIPPAQKLDSQTPADWRPVLAEANAAKAGAWAPVEREDGAMQWTYRGAPLFTNVFDTVPGDILGVRGSDLRFVTITPSGVPLQGIGQ